MYDLLKLGSQLFSSKKYGANYFEVHTIKVFFIFSVKIDKEDVSYLIEILGGTADTIADDEM